MLCFENDICVGPILRIIRTDYMEFVRVSELRLLFENSLML